LRWSPGPTPSGIRSTGTLEASPTFALIHSPFLGPASWRATADALSRLGETSRLVDLREALRVGGGFHAAFGALAARQIDGPAVLVAHSGAGSIVSSILEQMGNHATAVILVDALLPHPGRSWFETAPDGLARRLRATARDGLAPPWPRWLPEGALARLLPDVSMRETLIREAPDVPLALLTEPAPIVSATGPSGGQRYLQLSAAYGDEAEQAHALGWRCERFDGHHLSMMTDPTGVAAAIVNLAIELR